MLEQLEHYALDVLPLSSSSATSSMAERCLPQNRPGQVLQRMPRDQPEHPQNVGFLEVLPAKGDQLVQRGLGVPQPALRPARDGQQRVLVDLELLGLRDCRSRSTMSLTGMRRRSKRWQRERIVARIFPARSSRKRTSHAGRLFERLQQRIERGRREHVNFVDDVHFERPRDGA